MRQKLQLSVLDQSPVAAGGSQARALANSLDLARHAEALGYRRYWVAEHHASPGLAGAAPELLIAALAQVTDIIRLGSGGVMLPHYSPLKVAENFSLLAGLAPGRIDLGLGRAPGSDQRTAVALQRDRRQPAPSDFPNQLAELLGYLGDDLPADHPFAYLAATLPGRPELPEPWLLGSSPDSATWAGEFGLPYCIADFIAGPSVPLAAAYRAAFRPSRWCAAPRVAVALWTIAADTQAAADRLAASGRMMFARMMLGHLIAVPDPDVALAWLADHPELARGRAGRRTIVGPPGKVAAEIAAAAAEYGADEAFLVNILYDHTARRRSYELTAPAMAQRVAA